MAKDLFLAVCFVLFLGVTSQKALSWRLNGSSADDIGDPCPPSPHPLGMCKWRAANYGYPCENHKVTTKDGFILSVQRIPYGNSRAAKVDKKKRRRTPVLLFHGLMVDGVCWVLSSPEESLGFILADSGYDVWIANCRGTVFSRNHTSLTPNDPAYWDWSWEALAAHDLPAVFQYVYHHTGRKRVHYVGHSLGTLIILAAFSEHKLLHMVRSAALLCPIAYLDKMTSPLTLAAVRLFLAETTHWLGFHEFNPSGQAAHEILTRVCNDPVINCYDILSAVAGPDCCLNTSTVCTYLEHGPQSTSTRTLIHLSQMVREGGIRKYDYGNARENMKHYKHRRPPAYDFSSIPSHLPLFLAHGGQDYLGDPQDTRRLLKLLENHDEAKIEVLYVPKYAHADFILAYNARDLVFKPLVAFFKRH